uniref:Uncharacterized protein n=1 Tax=Glyptapanteles indiensis TaxID=92994 RepID=B7S8V9_GLYIN|nr:hypothetical protein GIP_L4_0160 [Glyptapanteles indiensis]
MTKSPPKLTQTAKSAKFYRKKRFILESAKKKAFYFGKRCNYRFITSSCNRNRSVFQNESSNSPQKSLNIIKNDQTFMTKSSPKLTQTVKSAEFYRKKLFILESAVIIGSLHRSAIETEALSKMNPQIPLKKV